MKKIYKIIPSFPNFEICDTESLDKCIRTIDTHEYCRVYIDNKGYPRVYLSKKLNGDGKIYLLHRLVCETYIGNIPEGMVIDHLNCDRMCFLHTNLKICSQKENCNNKISLKHYSESKKKYFKEHPEKAIEHSKKHKQYFSNIENRKRRAKPVLQIDKETGEILNEYFGTNEAERQTGIPATNISKCIRGKLKTTGGFIWKYKEQY